MEATAKSGMPDTATELDKLSTVDSSDPQQSLPKAKVEGDSPSSDISSSEDVSLDVVPSSLNDSLSHSYSQHGGHRSAHSMNSEHSNSSLKVFRRAADWRNSGHDSLSFLSPAEDADESENAADEDDLGVLCSRDSKRLKLLGEGASGEVWLVRHNHKSYALKVCAKYDLVTEGGVDEVVREREIMSQLDHPFIARIWATNQDANFVYILEDYLAGGEFFSVLARQENGRIVAPQAQVYAACIADALAYLHERHIVYRDLKYESSRDALLIGPVSDSRHSCIRQARKYNGLEARLSHSD